MGRVLFISALVHVAVLVALPFIPGLSRHYDLALDTYTVELVDLPSQPETPPAVEEPAPQEQQADVPAPVEEEQSIPEEPKAQPKHVVLKPPSPKQQKTLEERLEERLKAQDQKRPQETQDNRADAAPPHTSTARVSATRFPYSWYLAVVQGKVSSNWSQPSARLIVEDSLTTSVTFTIMRDGSVRAVSVSRSSGRSTVDQSAAKAVRDSTPFPPLPGDYRESSLDVTIDFTILRD